MKHLIIVFSCACLASHPATAEPGAPPQEESVARTSPDPMATCNAFFNAMRRCDLDAAVACFAYGKKEEEALKVALGIFIAHRRFEKAVDAKFGLDEKSRDMFDGWLRPDVTDSAINESVKRLARSTVKVNNDSSAAELRWGDEEWDGDYLDLPVKKLRKVDGMWKLDGGMRGDDFFEKGGWGRLFRSSMEMLTQAADKVTAGEFLTVEALKVHLDARQREIEQEYEKELTETNQKRMSRPGGGKKE